MSFLSLESFFEANIPIRIGVVKLLLRSSIRNFEQHGWRKLTSFDVVFWQGSYVVLRHRAAIEVADDACE